MFVAERYEESDSGTYEGFSASFAYHVKIDVTTASYSFETDWGTVAAIVLGVTLTVLGVGYLIYRIRWRTKNVEVRDLFAMGLSRVKVRRIWKKEQFPRLPNSATAFFEPFLPHWVEKALASKDRVAVAIDPQYGLVGVAFYVKEGKIGTVLCKHTELTEVLRSYIGCKDFFSEMIHSIQLTADMSQDPYLMSQLNQFGTQAFNVFETHNVYRLDQIRPTSYDADLVRPMRDEDLLPVTELAQKVYRCKAKKWISGNLKAGDMGVVAVADGKIVGFGFACICGQVGRLHTLGVDPAYRGRGIAKELHRARLETMRLMGIRTVIDEIADWNLPSIRISTLSGFQPIGKMYVETVRKKRIKKDIVRR
jgi:GNAT superfamily N-acetyltransferase